MKVYDPDEVCPKCGGDDLALDLQPALPERKNVMRLFDWQPEVYAAEPERLHLICGRCGWEDDRLPLDARAEVASRSGE